MFMQCINLQMRDSDGFLLMQLVVQSIRRLILYLVILYRTDCEGILCMRLVCKAVSAFAGCLCFDPEL